MENPDNPLAQQILKDAARAVLANSGYCRLGCADASGEGGLLWAMLNPGNPLAQSILATAAQSISDLSGSGQTGGTDDNPANEAGSVEASERMTETLEQQVAEKERVLREQFDRLRRFEREQVLIGERERIMRDMHDGIGGQLVSLITLLDSHAGPVFERVRTRLQHSLADLRLVIDSLDPLLSDLPTLLGMMRSRLLEQTTDHGIELEWCVTDLPAIGDFSPRRSLHIMRIVQEAVTNSIKHADTERITLATGVCSEDEEQVYIDIIDYGVGMGDSSMPEDNQGRGLKNMRHRAEQIDGSLEVSSSHECPDTYVLVSKPRRLERSSGPANSFISW